MTSLLASTARDAAPTPSPLGSGGRRVAAVFGAVLVWSACWRLTASSWLPDELLYSKVGAEYVAGDFSSNLEHPPLGKLLFGVVQRITGSDVLGSRLVAAGAAIAIGALLYALGRRIAGNRAGLLALCLWAVLPHAGGGVSGPLLQTDRLDRFGMLDPVATALGLAAVLLGWRLVRSPSWILASAVGLLGGLAAGIKVTGVLVLLAIAPVFLVVHRRDPWRAAAAIVMAFVGSVAGLALAYAPLGSTAWASFRYMLDFQAQHADGGHAIVILGESTLHPPWWAHLFLMVRDDGWALTLVLLGALIGAVAVARRNVGVVLVATVVLVLFGVHAAFAVKLPPYRYMWLPYLVLLLAVVLDRAWDAWIGAGPPGVRRALPAGPGARLLVAGAAAAALVVAVEGMQTLVAVARLAPADYQVVATMLEDRGMDQGPVVLRGRAPILAAYAPDLVLVEDIAAVDAVVLDEGITSRFPKPEVDRVLTDPAWTCTTSRGVALCLRR